eukprot:g20618.t1
MPHGPLDERVRLDDDSEHGGSRWTAPPGEVTVHTWQSSREESRPAEHETATEPAEYGEREEADELAHFEDMLHHISAYLSEELQDEEAEASRPCPLDKQRSREKRDPSSLILW